MRPAPTHHAALLLASALLAHASARPLHAQGAVELLPDVDFPVSAASPDTSWLVGVVQTEGDATTATARYNARAGTQVVPSWWTVFVDVSADGSAVLTNFRGELGMSSAGIWTAAGKVELGDLGGSSFVHLSIPRAMSDDGRFAAGNSWLDDSPATSARAFLWSAATGMQALETPAGMVSSAVQVSNDGSIVVGSLTPAGTADAEVVRWIDGALTPLGFQGKVRSASRDGKFVVGDRPEGVFRWSEAAGLEILGGLPPVSPLPEAALAGQVSDDGRTLLGVQGALLPNPMGPPILVRLRWFVWREGSGFLEARDLLSSLGAQDLADMDVSVTSTLSSDGNTIVGASSSIGASRALVWKAHLPPMAGDG